MRKDRINRISRQISTTAAHIPIRTTVLIKCMVRASISLFSMLIAIYQGKVPTGGVQDNILVLPCLRRNINVIYDAMALYKLYKIFKREKFDIVHTHTTKSGVLGRLAAYLAGSAKIIYMPHGHVFYGYFNFFISKLVVLLERFCGRFTHKILVFTELTKQDFN